MNEQEFDEIGKRLYELEADPPENGWKRIGAVIQPGPVALTISWVKRHWTKSIPIAIAFLLYFGYQQRDHIYLAGNKNEFATIIEKGLETQSESTSKNRLEYTDKNSENTEQPSSKLPSLQESYVNEHNNRANSLSNISGKDSSLPKSKLKAENTTLATKEGSSRPFETSQNSSFDYSKDELESNREIRSGAGTTPLIPADQLISPPAENDLNELKRDVNSNSANSIVANDASVGKLALDSAINFVDSITKQDSVSENVSAVNKESNSSPTWRLTASFMPQILGQTASPVASDDVFVTDFKQTKSLKRTGADFAIGVSRSLSPNWQLNAQVSYTRMNQELSYTYSDGKVDTLLREQQADQSVRVIPVYQTDTRDVSSTYHYAGASLGTTFYFWSKAKTRFNFSLSGNAHYLIAYSTQERIADNWIEINEKDIEKLNFSFTIGAGYNIVLYRGLELMIAPSLKYYLRDIRSAELPYKLSERSAGINFMLSKTIGH